MNIFTDMFCSEHPSNADLPWGSLPAAGLPGGSAPAHVAPPRSTGLPRHGDTRWTPGAPTCLLGWAEALLRTSVWFSSKHIQICTHLGNLTYRIQDTKSQLMTDSPKIIGTVQYPNLMQIQSNVIFYSKISINIIT